MAKNETEKVLEEIKIKALEKIANSFLSLPVWCSDIDKAEFSPGIEWYLSMWKEKFIDEE